jgi:YD repeat-containing protein
MTTYLQRQGGAGKASKRSLAMGAGAVDMGNLDKVQADGNVKLTQRSYDDQGHLTGRLEVNSSRLNYDARAKIAEIPVPGTAVVEDYRPPNANAPAPPTGQAAPAMGPLGAAGQPSVDRPSVTAFTWDQSMALSQVDRTVNMAGDVKMRHRSSRRVLDVLNPQELARLNVPAWPAQMPAGRDTSLRCEHLLAQFGQPPADQPSATARFAGPLEMFEATTAVLMEDGDYRVEAQHVIYDSRSDVVSIHGYLPGQPPADARVVVRQPPSVIQSPDIIWNRTTNKITTGAVRGTGSGMRSR